MLTKPQIIQLPKILDRRGNLSVIEENDHIPFKIERTFGVYDVPGTELDSLSRAHHLAQSRSDRNNNRWNSSIF